MNAPTVLILQPDTFAANAVARAVREITPAAACLATNRLDEAKAALARDRVELFLTALELPGGDALDLLLQAGWPMRSPRVLVTTARCAPRIVASLRVLAVQGVFDVAREPGERLLDAIEAVAAGRSYWSSAFLAKLNDQEFRTVLHQLSPAEQLGLAVLGDGCTDATAAGLFGMEHSSVRSLRKRIRSKLQLGEGEDLVASAARLGYTRVAASGLTACGLAVLIMEYLCYSQRPTALSEALLNRCGLSLQEVGARSHRHNKHIRARPQTLATI